MPSAPPADLLLGDERLSEAFRAAAKMLKPSVGTITSSVDVAGNSRNRLGEIGDLGLPPGFEDSLPPEMLEQLRRDRGADASQVRAAPVDRMQSGMGSGVIVTEGGAILTNNHVIADADELQVGLSDGRVFTAAVLGDVHPTRQSRVAVTSDFALESSAMR